MYALIVCRAFGQAHGGNLGIGKHHRRQERQVQGGITAGHVDRCPGSGGRGHVYKLRLVGAVAGGVDRRHRGAHVIVNDDGAARVDGDTGLGQIQRIGIGPAAGGHQQVIATDFSRLGLQHEHLTVMGHDVRLPMGQYLYAFDLQRALQARAYGRILSGKQRAAHHHGYLGAQAPKGLGQFHGHRRATEHDQVPGNIFRHQGLGGGPIRRLRQPLNLRYRRPRAHGEQDAIRAQGVLRALGLGDDERSGILETRLTAHQGDSGIRRQYAFVFCMPQLRHALLLLLNEQGPVDAGRGVRNSLEGMPRLQVRNVRRA